MHPLLRSLPTYGVSPTLAHWTVQETPEELVARIHPDIVHVHTPLLCLRLIYRSDVPVVYTRHAAILKQEPTWREIGSRVAAFVAVAEFIARRAFEVGIPRGKIYTIHNGVELDRFTRDRGEAKRELGVGGLTIGFAGRFVELKNLVSVLRVITPLLEKHDAHFVLFGQGEEGAKLKALRTPRVHFAGYRQAEDLARLLPALDAIILYSLSEACSVFCLEALAVGAVPVLSDIPGNRELAGDCGVYAPPYEPWKLYEVLDSLLSNRQGIGVRSKQVRERASLFSAARAAQATAEVYQGVLNGAGPSRCVG